MSDIALGTQTNRSWFTRALPGVVAGAGALAIAVWNPSDTDVTICFSKRLFGIDCPGCGGLRTVNSLLRGDLLGALDHNVILALGLPVLAIMWLLWFLEPLTGKRIHVPEPPKWVTVSVTLALFGFMVLRNIDGPAWIQWLASDSYR